MYNASGSAMTGAGIAYAATDYAATAPMIGFTAIAVGGILFALGAWRSKRKVNAEM